MGLLEKTGNWRLNKFSALMEENGFDFLLLTQPVSFEYLVFSKIPFLCIIKKGEKPAIFTHQDSINIVKDQTWTSNLIGLYPYNIGTGVKNNVERNYLAKAVEYIRSHSVSFKKVGIDFLNTPLNVYNYFNDSLKDFKIADCSNLLSCVYAIKTGEELDLIKQAAKIAELGIIKTKEFLENSKGPITENMLAAYAEYHMRKLDVDGFFVRSSVTSGYRTVLMGATDSEKKIGIKEIIDADYSPVYKRYYADICRVLSISKLSPEVIERCKVVEHALDIAIDSIKPGAFARDIDLKVRNYFAESGYDGEFIHHTGHPIGNSWGTMLTPNSTGIIEEGMVFAIEPGLYNNKIGGVRIEDNVYVSAKGAENMMSIQRILK